MKLYFFLAMVLLVASESSLAASKAGSRKKIITQEKMIKSKKGSASTKIDFEAVDISGERKLPLGSSINQTRANKDGGFVKLRTEWHSEMIQSASSL
ncbi:MAG: hypothetical protein WCI18_03055 [Pseudomonadota bacterium]